MRLARREAWKTKGQSALIICLIFIPVAAVAAVATVGQSHIPTAAESVTTKMGDAQAVLRVVSPPDKSLTQQPTDPQSWQVERDGSTGIRANSDPHDPLAAPSSVFARGTPIIEVHDSELITVKTATGRGSLLYVEGAVWDGSLNGLYAVESGRVPRAAGEVLVTASALDRLGKRIGDTINVFEPRTSNLKIVGTIRDNSHPATINVIYAPIGTINTGTWNPKSSQFYLPSTPLSWERVSQLNKSGYVIWSREVFLNPPATGTFVQVPDGQRATEGLIAGIAIFSLFEVALLAGAAFMVGARRQQRNLALLASVGAERRTLFQMVTSTGLILGSIAGATGTIGGMLAGYLVYISTNNGDRSEYPGFHANILLLLGVAIAAAIVGWIAAAVPAIIASRLNVLSALRDATRPSKSHRSMTKAGLIVLGTGALLLTAATAILGTTEWVHTLEDSTLQSRPIMVIGIVGICVAAVVIQVSVILLVPGVFAWLSSRVSRSALPVRLAARDLSRNSGRSTPVVAVIMSTVWIAIITLSFQTYIGTIAAAYRTDAALTGQGILPTYSEASPNPTVQEAQVATTRLAELVRAHFKGSTVSIVQRPQTDWTSFWTGEGSATEVEAVRAPEQLCPADPKAPGYPNSDDPAAARALSDKYAHDPRCDLRRNPSLFSANGPGVFHILIGGPSELAQLSGNPSTAATKAALAAGEAISFWPELVHDNHVTLEWNVVGAGAPGKVTRTESLPAIVVEPQERLLDGLFISPATAKKLGIVPVDGLVFVDFATHPSVSTLDAANADFAAALPSSVPLYIARDPADDQRAANWLALVLVLLVSLSATAVAIGLNRIDGRPNQLTLRAIGGGDGLARGMSATSAGMMALVATIGGTATALVPLYCLFGITDVPFSPPWLQIAIIVVGFPLGFALVAAMLRPQIESRKTPLKVHFDHLAPASRSRRN